jgi:phage protein D
MATTAIDIFANHQTFYVPQFQVSIAGKTLEDGLLRDVMQVTYRDNVEEIDSFELVVNNWDAGARLPQPKYEPPSQPKHKGIFDPGQRLELRMGYMKEMTLMLTGEITTLEPNFPEGSAPTLSVRGLNVLHTLRTEQHSEHWDDQKDSDIATDLGDRSLQAGKAGLGIKVKTDPAADETAESFVMMYHQYDILFLMERARRHGYDLVLNEKSPTNPERSLYFGPSKTKRETPNYKLVWGKTLCSFKPKLSTAKQVGAVTVRGWDRQNNQPIEETATWQDVVKGGPEQQRMSLIKQAFEGRTEIVTSQPVRNKGEAKQKAIDTLNRQLREMVTASGSTVGLPLLRAGRKVEIEKLGLRYSGIYYVTSTTHTIGEGGYRTQFECRRDPADQPPGGAP